MLPFFSPFLQCQHVSQATHTHAHTQQSAHTGWMDPAYSIRPWGHSICWQCGNACLGLTDALYWAEALHLDYSCCKCLGTLSCKASAL